MAHTPPVVPGKPAPWIWKLFAGIVALLILASFLVGRGEEKGSVVAAIKNGAIAGEERLPPMCADYGGEVVLAEAGVYRVKSFDECFWRIIKPPLGSEIEVRSIPNKGLWVLEILGNGPRFYPPYDPASTKQIPRIRGPFRTSGPGDLLVGVSWPGEKSPLPIVVRPNDYGQPGWDPCNIIEAISLNESDTQLFEVEPKEPSCFWLFSKNASRYTFNIVVKTDGLEASTVQNGPFRKLLPGEELLEGTEITIRGTGKATITAAPDPNQPAQNQNQDPNQ